MMDELRRLKELTEVLTGNGYLQDQAAEWEYALDAIPEYVYIINTQHNLKFVNKALAQRLGVEREDVYDKKCYSIIKGKKDPDSGTCDFPPDCCDIERDLSSSGETFLESLYGWFQYDRSPIYTKTNKLIGFICILNDITDQKEAQRAAKDSEDRYRELFNIAPAAIYELDYRKGKIVNINKIFSDYTGYTKEEILAMDPLDLLTYESKALFASRLERVRAGKKISSTAEYEIMKKNGETLWLEINNRYIYENDDVVATTVVATDISERKSAEESLKSELKEFLNNVDNSKKILIVEDQRGLAKLMASFLKKKGYVVEVALDGNRASELIDANGICLVIVDLSLPAGLSGLDIVKKVAKEHEAIPIIIVSGTASVIDVNEAMRSGAWDYLAKPVGMEELTETIERNLKQSVYIKKSKLLDEFLELNN